MDRKSPTQVGRAPRVVSSTRQRASPAQLGVEHIAAYSLQARGRSERPFGTPAFAGAGSLQDRLVKELALAGIATVAAANDFIRDVYIPAHNARFAAKAGHEGSAFVAIAGVDLAEVLCVQEERQVGNDNTVVFHKLRLQIAPSPLSRALCRIHREGAAISRRQPRDLPLAALHPPLQRPRHLADRGFRYGRMKHSKGTAAFGFMDNASALPTTPQAPHQPQKRRQYSLPKAAGIRPRDDHQGHLICRKSDRRCKTPNTRRNRSATSGQSECYVNRTIQLAIDSQDCASRLRR